MPTSGKLMKIACSKGQDVETLIVDLLNANEHVASRVAFKLSVYPNTILHWLDANSYYFDKETRRWVKRQPETTSAA